ncbi:glycerol uptake operon antiterminator regulatory protein [Petrotoga mexicana DSM 14811]|uniref:Glycerol uptake operon antiterminator regulatory protein n=1 Tax=Petrotoga mexicana DSM 14811 TaxID=1122954 RepID=A0A2K1P774_9BACT|nr:glycerol-3-phosphate responsive antiterminator [Petrotoga mexicana]PNR98650.1 glycerol uptake operon antiterminator regulatory protein [Petrotoga mexicana DSM 14811]
MKGLCNLIKKNTIIPAIRDLNDLDDALKTESPIIFLLTGSILILEDVMPIVKQFNKKLFINIDLLEGIASDKKGIEYLARKQLCDGIISTKNNAIKTAMQENLMAVQRVFLLDSGSLKSVVNFLEKTSQPDAFEILPAIAAPYFLENIETKVCLIAGGLVAKKSETLDLFKKGIHAISTSTKDLW